jgi:serine protease Do
MRPAAALAAVALCSPALVTAQAAAPKAKSLPGGLERISAEFTDLVERVAPSVVRLETKGLATAQASSGAVVTRSRGMGSGVIVDADGYIVTNAHVVAGADHVDAYLFTPRAPGGSILQPKNRGVGAHLVGVDNETDIAVLRLEAKGLPALPFADYDTVRQGQVVFAFGNPLGLENSVSMGVVSSVARQLDTDSPMIYLQTDASINPGNSGGPLVDTSGRIVGINTAIYSQSGGNEGVGFAAPSHIVRAMYEQIRAHGRVRRGGIGVHGQTVSPLLAAGLGLPAEAAVILGDVTPGGSGEAAGLRTGDVVLAVNGRLMENARQVDVTLYRMPPGQTPTFTILRDGRRMEVPVTVQEKVDESERLAMLVDQDKNLIPKLGILAVELNDDVLKILPKLRGNDGVLVAARAAAGGSDDDDLKAGDVIYALNGLSIRSLAELRAAVARVKRGDALVFQVERKGQLTYLAQAAE